MLQHLESAATVETVHDLPAHAERRHFRLGLRAGTPWSIACVGVDVAMLTLAAVATAFGANAVGSARPSSSWALGFCAVVMLLSGTRGLYAPAFSLRTVDDLRKIAGATTLAAASLLATAAVFQADRAAVDEVLRLWMFATAYLSAGRASLYWSQLQARRAGEGLRPTLIVGAGRVGRLAAQRLLDRPQLGLKPIGFLDKNPMADDGKGTLLPVLGASWDLEQVIREHGVEQAIITFSTAPNDVMLRLVRRCEELGVAVAVVPRLYEQTTTRLSVDHIGGIPLVAAHPADPRGLEFAVKYAIDRIVSTALVLVFSPILIGAAVATYLSLGRPIFFRQRRVGRDGVEFDMLKFRTMRGSPEDRGETDAGWAMRQLEEVAAETTAEAEDDDPRTAVGRVLRRASIDELPQLLNVVMGHMSLVGPRPERVHYVRRFEQNVYRYGDRHRVKSGITGWAQVNGLRGQTSLKDRVEWDNHYIENFSLWLDVKILLLTCAAVFAWFASGE